MRSSQSYLLTDLIGGRGEGGSETAHLSNVPATLTALASRVCRLAPCHRHPERFYDEKSEIAHALRVFALEVSHG